MGLLKKRSFAIAHHRTSVALEEEFWAVLETACRKERISLAAFVAKIDSGRGEVPLARALRLYALAAARSQT
ncbi:MAG: ribbon-helix-helix domain-containing protein [Alphaproteobacteria bacterium]|nr:ribbon-helix-helix domain-containing protein [Alphaproteobacteria bacterium]